MTRRNLIQGSAVLAALSLIATACLPGGGSDGAETTPTPQADVGAARTVTVSTPLPQPSPTELPVLPSLSSYTVRSGDNPTSIAENAGVPVGERDAWISEMLKLNGVDAHSLQVGQALILPPLGDGRPPTVNTANSTTTATNVTGNANPPAGIVVQPAQPLPTSDFPALPTATKAPAGVPFAPTPPFVAFTTPTATPTPSATPTPRATATPTAAPTIAPGERAWLTSSDETAVYYYCDLDSGWRNIPAEKLLAFDSEQQLLAIWGRFRVKAPDSVC